MIAARFRVKLEFDISGIHNTFDIIERLERLEKDGQLTFTQRDVQMRKGGN